MSLFARLLQAVRSWRRRSGRVRTVRNSSVAMEQLDHRQMLSVTFTGNVATDFPATQTPGVVILPDNASVQHPTIPANLQGLIGVSGFDITSLRVSYSPENNGTLSIGIEQPANPKDSAGRPVIATDADNNGNWGTVNPAVTAVSPGFQDVPDIGGTEFMGVYLDFLGTGTGQVVAGFSQNVPSGQDAKVFQVATANQAGPNVAPTFGTPLPQFRGNIYTQNDPNHPNIEMSLVNFDTLYQSITGSAIVPTSVFNVGAFAGSAQDGPISEAFFPEQPVLLSAATPPTPEPPVCPPISPPILINPHEHRIIDTAHADLVRVYIQGTSGFDPATIDPATALLNGASPVATQVHHFPRSPYAAQVFIFKASDIQADPGLQTLTFTAKTFDGQQIITSNQVVNITNSASAAGRLKFLMNRNVDSQYTALKRVARSNPDAILDWSVFDRSAGTAAAGATASPATVNLGTASASVASALTVDYSSTARQGILTPVAAPRQVVNVQTEQGASRLSGRLKNSLASYLDSVTPSTAPAAPMEAVLSGAN
ncbi:hypothetical protein [Paludisphaera mucosa]|uniref:Uncharacterized protein n=1 Tax=Paludisphaera mucosa TaxID=3030827 RepID=A0ABT6F8Q6_9BACT|nr:hypothetical protein [Paludisphaera mucosa]MDG3003963.1 hypothetical protein [Paludisphaera mucosa]